jgi:hypothetical protein
MIQEKLFVSLAIAILKLVKLLSIFLVSNCQQSFLLPAKFWDRAIADPHNSQAFVVPVAGWVFPLFSFFSSFLLRFSAFFC